MLTALMLRPELEVSVLHDRNPLYVKLSDGGLRNGYTVKILNKVYQPRAFKLGVSGLAGRDGQHRRSGAARPIPSSPSRPTSSSRSRVYVTLDKAAVRALPDRIHRVPLRGHAGSTGTTSAQHESDLPGSPSDDRAHLARRTASQGRHVLWGSVGFLRRDASSSTAIFVYVAAATFSGGDTSDPYRKGLDYNATLSGGGAAGRARLADRDRL